MSKVFLTLCFFSNLAYSDALPVTPENIGKGKIVFKTNCAICHGDTGEGNGPGGAALNPKPRNFLVDKFKKGDSPNEIFNTVTNGLAGTAMASFSSLPEADRGAVAVYVNSLRKK
jgi:high-affinity iron transporter